MADGTVLIAVDVETGAAEKSLRALTGRIQNLRGALAKGGGGAMEGRIQAAGEAAEDSAGQLKALEGAAGLTVRQLVGQARAMDGAISGEFAEAAGRSAQALSGYAQAGSGAVTELKTALAGLKTALASAFAPILTAAAPALTALINLLAQAVYYVAALLGLLGASGAYDTAAEGLSAVGAAASSAGGSAAEAQRLFSGLDEINTFDSSSGGGGGGGTGGSDSTAALIPEEQVFSLNEKFKDILWYAAAIGAAIAGWKIAKSFGADLKTAAGLAMALGGSVLFVKGYMDAWLNGIDTTNLTEMLAGAALAVTGLGLALGPVGAAVGALAAGIALVVLALREWSQTGELSRQGCIALCAGILLVGGALSLLTGSWLPIVAAAALAVVAAVAANWDEIREKTGEIFGRVRDKLGEIWERIASLIKDRLDSIKAAVTSVFAFIQTWVAAKMESVKNGIMRALAIIENLFGVDLSAIRQSVTDTFGSIQEEIAGKMEDARQAVSTVIEKIKKILDFEWSLPNLKLPRISITGKFSLNPVQVPKFSIKWAARGGIVDGATLIGAGEAGAEAIVPLERHTEWIDLVAGRLGALLRAGDGALAGPLEALAAAVLALGDSLAAMPQSAVAAGAVTPPGAVSGGGMEEALAGIQELLARLTGQQSGARTYTFTANLNRRTLFREVLDEAAMEQTRTGRNPFEM